MHPYFSAILKNVLCSPFLTAEAYNTGRELRRFKRMVGDKFTESDGIIQEMYKILKEMNVGWGMLKTHFYMRQVIIGDYLPLDTREGVERLFRVGLYT